MFNKEDTAKKAESLLSIIWHRLWKREAKDSAYQYQDSEAQIMQVVQRMEGVIAVQSCRTKEQGHYVTAELVIHVNPMITVQEGNNIALRVRWLLLNRFSHLTHIAVYVKPFSTAYPYKSNELTTHDHSTTSLLQ